MKTRTVKKQMEEILSDPVFMHPSQNTGIRVKRLEGMTVLLAEAIDKINTIDKMNTDEIK